MKTMTVRNIPDDVAAWLSDEARGRGASINTTAVAVLTAAAFPGAGKRKRDLSAYFGTWNRAEARRFDQVTREAFGRVDEGEWK